MVSVQSHLTLGTIAFVITVCLLALPANAKYSGGSGTAQDPYQIATAADLIALGETPEDYDKHFILTADIDLDPNLPGRKVFDGAVIAPDANDTKSWFTGSPFSGLFDGKGHVIRRLHIQGAGYLGLFGALTGSVCNVGLEAVEVSGTDAIVGGLVGHNATAGRVVASHSSGSVSGAWDVGGLVGQNDGTIRNCYAAGTVVGRFSVGGLAGHNGRSTYGGSCLPAEISDCYSTSSVTAPNEGGGLLGSNCAGPVTDCFWDIETSRQATSAGGTGKTTREMQEAHTFLLWATCGNAGTWTIDEGRDYPRLWWEHRPGTPVALASSLRGLLDGEGTERDPYLIRSAEELNLVGLFPCDWDKHFKLMADVDLSGYDGRDGRPQFNAIGGDCYEVYDSQDGGLDVGTAFTGVFDGNSHTISHLTIAGQSLCAGLFRSMVSGGQIRNLGIVDVNVISGRGVAGGLVAWNSGTVTQCYVTGRIGGGSYAGGLVGDNWGGTVTQCYSTATVSGAGVVGGLVGGNGGTVTQCHSTGTVSGTYGVGGLVGSNGGTVAQCHSTGAVSGQNDVGGLVGCNYGRISTTFSAGPVNGDEDVGGLVGQNSRLIINSYARGPVNGTSSVGGLVGWNYVWNYSQGASIAMSYSSGSVNGAKDVGGLVGSSRYADNSLLYRIITASFWDAQTSGFLASEGGTGKTTVEMQTVGTFLDAGWDFVGETANGAEDIWKIAEGLDYPRLWWETTEE